MAWSAIHRPSERKGYAASTNSLAGSTMLPWSSWFHASREPIHVSSSVVVE